MSPSRFPRAPAVLLTATLAATVSAVEFGSENDVTQTAGTVAPGGEMPTSTAASGANGFGNFDSPTQWTASSSNNAPTNPPVVASSGSGGWSQPTTTDTPTVWSGGSGQSSGSGQGWASPTTDSPSMWTPTSGQASGSGNQGWSQPISTDFPSGWTPSSGEGNGAEGQGWTSTASSTAWTPSSGESSGYDDQTLTVDCSGSSEGGWSPGGEVSLECSGSDEETPSVATSVAGSSNFTPTTTTAPTTSSGADEQPSSTASSSSTAASAENEDTPQTSSTPSMSTSTAGSSSITPTTTTTSSGNSDQPPSSMNSSSNTPTSMASGEYENSTPTTTSSLSSSVGSTTSSGIGDQQDSSQVSSPPATTTSGTGEQVDSTTAQASTNSTGSREHATFGTITSGSDKCVVGDPDTYLSPEDLEWIWENRMKAEVTSYNNWILDHLVANKGSINYCVRWDSDQKLTKETASKFQDMLSRQHAAWNHWLIGYNCWPYDEIKVNIVGFAAKDKSLLGWSDDSLGTIYAGDLDKDGSPQCPTNCYRSYNDGATDGWSESSGCKGEPFDISLWPKQGLGGGWGTYWGQQVNLDNMLEHLDDQELEIVSHEMGHGFGLPDFYQEPKPANFKPCLMDGLTSAYVRDTDGWMLRRVLENKKANYNF
ncbi:hypothetical protein PRNP1_015024 [Phytophthora ramorum]